MSTSRLFSLLGTSIFRNYQTTPSFLPSAPSFRSLKPFRSPHLLFHRYCSSTASVNEENGAGIDDGGSELSLKSNFHPWPEWVTFVDSLKAKGYISESASGESESAAADGGKVYTDMNLLKDACLKFGRDRYDIFKSLCRQEIQSVVEKGCPNILRKAVNSAKRLRAYVGLVEGDVCSACVLRGSCDRANVILEESEAVPRTVDAVRILLLYALDPSVIDGGIKTEDRDILEVSARNLLNELTELSESIPAPDPPEPSVNVSRKNQKHISFVADDNPPDVEMKRGDWICSKCNFMNFARNSQCLKCKGDGPTTINAGDVEMKKGDWICSQCNFMNFSRNKRCLKCRAEGPKRASMGNVEMKKGDWNCPQCGFMNFASNIRCLRCHDSRPKSDLRPGEWECPKCNYLNFRGNTSCRKCNHECPEDVDTENEDMTWKQPY